MDLVSIIERLAELKAERELKNFHASPNGAAILSDPHKNGIAQKDIFESEQVRVSIVSVLKDADWSLPHDGRDRIVVLLDKINQPAETDERKSSSSARRVTWIPANRYVSATNESDQTKNLVILEFKDGAAEQALVRTEAPRRKASQ